MEEEKLLKAYGEQYRMYRHKTGRVIPFVR
jgi:protein-S-isoprenylcysteine O-methyltransferase Ste14